MTYLIVFLLTILNNNYSEKDNKCKEVWLPEKYVYAMESKEPNADEYLIPIEGFETPFTNCHILTYKGELNPINTKALTLNGKEKHQLLNLAYYVNLKYNSRELADKLLNASIYISMDEDKLLLEIIESDKTEEIYFVNKFNGFKFKSIESAKRHLLKLK